ncbi:MAG: hypothetical protein F6K31_37150, partial [Symploca sp. SIO2G7]|nr:hypothetical protein [Symploca sp. SIO2G7]
MPPQWGHGYRQTIQLRDDLSLTIHDYQLSQDLALDGPGESDRLEFEFFLPGSVRAGNSFCVPCLGFKQLTFNETKRVFKFEVVFQQPSLMTYGQAVMERFSAPDQIVMAQFKQYLWQLFGKPSTPPEKLFKQILRGEAALSLSPDEGLPRGLHDDLIAFQYANRRSMTPAMESAAGQFKICPAA